MRTLLRWTGRIVVAVVIVIVAWLAVGAAYTRYAASRDASATPPLGRRIDIGGRAIALYCLGTGSPTVVLESALGGPLVLWQQMQPEISQHTRVCSYDRDGIGWSDESGLPRTASRFADDLHKTLAGGGERGPFVLVAHSFGGVLALNYARDFPADVAGLVLLDPTHPRQFAPGGDQWADHQQMLPYFRLGPWLANAGVARQMLWAMDKLKPLPLSPDLREAYRAVMATPKGTGALRREAEALYAICDSSMTLPNLGDLPLLVLSAVRSGDDGFPPALHEELARLSSHGVRRVVNASHSGLVLTPASAKISTAAVLEIVDSVRARGARRP